MRFWPTRPRTLMRKSSIVCWPRRTMASGWPCSGSTAPVMPTATAFRPTTSASCGAGATGSSTPSTATCLRPVHDRAVGRRPAAQRHARPENRHRLQPQSPRSTPKAASSPRSGGSKRHRPRRDHLDGLAGADDGLLPLPRSQVRPDHAEGFLPASSPSSTTCRKGHGAGSPATRRRLIRQAPDAASSSAAGDRKKRQSKRTQDAKREAQRCRQMRVGKHGLTTKRHWSAAADPGSDGSSLGGRVLTRPGRRHGVAPSTARTAISDAYTLEPTRPRRSRPSVWKCCRTTSIRRGDWAGRRMATLC